MNAIMRGGPIDGQIKIVRASVKVDRGINYITPDKPGDVGWYGVVMTRDLKPLVDKQGFLILVWCGWDGEGVE